MEHYKTKGTCSTAIDFEVEGDTIQSVQFTNGCNGNTQGLSLLLKGRNIDEVIELLKDVTCQGGTSCPAQLAQALIEYRAR